MVKLTFSLVRLEGRVRLFTLLREKLVVSEAADQLATAVLGGVCAARSARVAPSSKGGGRWTDDRAYTRIIFGILHPPAPRSLSIGIASVVASLFCALSRCLCCHPYRSLLATRCVRQITCLASLRLTVFQSIRVPLFSSCTLLHACLFRSHYILQRWCSLKKAVFGPHAFFSISVRPETGWWKSKDSSETYLRLVANSRAPSFYTLIYITPWSLILSGIVPFVIRIRIKLVRYKLKLW